MKTSNKLLLGLLAVVIVGMIIINIVLKKQYDSRRNSNIKIEVNTTSDTTSIKGDSIAMDEAIGNE
ncbi:MAG: hypothetical protein Q8904_10365 [Bacteroidota bacterium]|nr:hypothetical protein [Bacteroidota bacterium]